MVVHHWGIAARAAVVLSLSLPALAGPYAPAAGQPGSTAIAESSAAIVEFASGAQIARGPQSIANPGGGLATVGSAADAIGNNAGVVSLGDGGSATLTFSQPITDGPGFDFAVFENGFSDTFLELAFVEVSSNGTDFFRFPSVSLTPTGTQVASFGTLDPTNLNNLAGKYRVNFGTPFDLSELAGVSPLLNILNVTQVRVVDVVGSINDAYAAFDSQGHKVNDPWPTAFTSSGFDLDAVGVMNAVPEPSMAGLCAIAMLIASRWSRLRRT